MYLVQVLYLTPTLAYTQYVQRTFIKKTQFDGTIVFQWFYLYNVTGTYGNHIDSMCVFLL